MYLEQAMRVSPAPRVGLRRIDTGFSIGPKVFKGCVVPPSSSEWETRLGPVAETLVSDKQGNFPSACVLSLGAICMVWINVCVPQKFKC